MSARAEPTTSRQRLAGYWNAWFSQVELAKARALAASGSEEECRAELARLEGERRSRVESWRGSK